MLSSEIHRTIRPTEENVDSQFVRIKKMEYYRSCIVTLRDEAVTIQNSKQPADTITSWPTKLMKYIWAAY